MDCLPLTILSELKITPGGSNVGGMQRSQIIGMIGLGLVPGVEECRFTMINYSVNWKGNYNRWWKLINRLSEKESYWCESHTYRRERVWAPNDPDKWDQWFNSKEG